VIDRRAVTGHPRPIRWSSKAPTQTSSRRSTAGAAAQQAIAADGSRELRWHVPQLNAKSLGSTPFPL